MTNRHVDGNVVGLGRINNYSDDVVFAAEIDINGKYKMMLETPAAAGGAAAVGGLSPGPFGNNVVVSANSVVHGYDWLGQPMSEKIAAGAGKKAFRSIAAITDSATATWGTKFGLPYATSDSGVIDDGTVTAAIATDPATITTGDPRGVIVFTVAPDGATDKAVTFEVNEALYGVKQFADFSVDAYA